MAESPFAGKLGGLSSWTKAGDTLAITVAVDVGASGLRIRVSNAADSKQFEDLGHVVADSTAKAVAIMQSLGDSIHSVVAKFETKGATIAVAGPIVGESVVVTNWSGPVEGRTITLSGLPAVVFPRGRSALLNDLEAGAYGLLAADEQGILGKHFEQLFKDRAPQGPILGKRTVILAMGSGLGIGLVVKDEKESGVIPTECGHLQIPLRLKAHPTYAEELDLLEKVSAHWYGEAKLAPEFEDIASGRGLKLVYHLLSGQPLEESDAKVVVEKARKGDEVAKKALLWNNLILIRAAKSVATSMNCESVVLALDNQVHNLWFVKEVEQALAEEFYEFIRPDWMARIRVYTQTELLNFNVLGTAYVAQRKA